MILNLALRWLVTGLFAVSAAECGLAAVATRRPWTFVVGHGLHFVMSVAMVAMTWPWGAQLPPRVPAVFFLLATVWFLAVGASAARSSGPRVVYGYSGLMMLATAWMYAIMDPRLRPAGSSAPSGVPVPGIHEGAMAMPTSSGSPAWFVAVNWLGALGFALATAFWAGRYFTEQPHSDVGGIRSRSLANLGQAAMAGGMALLFLATLFPV
jgi:hypothetical protein